MISEWLDVVNNSEYNTAERCLRMACLLESSRFDVDHYMDLLDEIGASVKSPEISELNRTIFGRYGFGPDLHDYYNPKNNLLNEVIDSRSGIPVTLAVLYADIASRAGLHLDIIGFPGHVLVGLGRQTFIDPFGRGRLATTETMHDILKSVYGRPVPPRPEFLKPIDDCAILVRIARNLKDSYASSYAYDKALKCTEMILAVDGHWTAFDIRDKGLLAGRLKNYAESLECLDRYVRLNPNGPDIDHILSIIKNTRDLF